MSTFTEEKNNFMYNKNELTDILIYNKMDPQFWDIFNKNNTLFLFEEFKNNFNNFEERVQFKLFTAKAILNFIGNESEYYAHKDFNDVISCQCIGSIEYRIYENIDCEFSKPVNVDKLNYKSYFMNPGDIIYIPSGTIHQVIVKEPRATILFDFIKKTEEHIKDMLGEK